MAKPTNQERRKQALKQRRAEEQREFDRDEAEYVFGDALEAYEDGDIPAADRMLKKALILDPQQARAMQLLAQIHATAGHYAEALAYLQRARKLDADPKLIYNIAVLHHQLGQSAKGVGFMREFLATIEKRRESEWRALRKSAVDFVTYTRPGRYPPGARAASRQSTAARARAAPESVAAVPAPTAKSETPRAAVQFFPAATPAFAQSGTWPITFYGASGSNCTWRRISRI